jgi:PadR family transcriptional regulator PadR
MKYLALGVAALVAAGAGQISPSEAAPVRAAPAEGVPPKIGMFQFAVLSAVSHLGPDAYPAEVSRYLNRTLGRRVSLAQVFVALERLEDKGLVTWREFLPQPARGGRRRRIFQLEEPGAQAIRELATTFDRASSGIEEVLDRYEQKPAVA